MTFDDLDPPYGTIVIDVPWPADNTQRLGGKGRRKTAHAGYQRMTLEDIAQIDLQALAAPAAHLYAWITPGALLRGEHEVIRAWGFDPLAIICWHKTGRIGLGQYFRHDVEFCVFAKRGWGTVPGTAWPSTWIEAPRGRHSVKPDAFFDAVEQVSPGPYLEMFARTPRLGWDHHGAGFDLQPQETA